MNGKHVCKPENQPQVGQVKNLIVLGDKIKNKKPEEGGQPYRIVSVTPDPTYSDNYKNVGFYLEIEPANGVESSMAGLSTPRMTPPQAQVDRGRAGTGNWSDDRSNRIERQHSQEMALRYMYLKFPTGIPEGVDGTAIVRELTSWFQRDVGRSPDKPIPTHAEPQDPQTDPTDEVF